MIYKDALPQDTVDRIKAILNLLGIKTRETLYEYKGICYSCRISIDNYGLESLDIGANGKGMTPEYSLASGYAELMERMQNKFLVNEAMRHATKIAHGNGMPFRFFPDEKLVQCSLRSFFRHIQYLFPNYSCKDEEYFCEIAIGPSNRAWEYMGCDDTSPQMEWLGVPYVSFSENQNYRNLEYVPIILARANSSTGLCAGNTPEEAILQGINEIFERYVLQRIYLDNITPPSFPRHFFEGTIVNERLKQLLAEGYIYDVKDMSLGKGFPVVGLILTNTTNGTTMFRLGADLSAEIALERCLTEIYQGRLNSQMRFLEYPIHGTIDMENDENIRNSEYRKSLKDGTGYFPKSLFMGKPTYEFCSPLFERSGNTRLDFKNVLRFLYERGYTPLVRDNSFLDFCSYHVLIPGLSEQDYRLRNVFAEYFASFDLDIGNKRGVSYECDGKQWPLYNIRRNEDLREFIYEHYPNDKTLKLAPYQNVPQNFINKSLLLFLFAVRNEDYEDANTHFTVFMQQRQKQGCSYNEYLACVGSYIYLQSKETKWENMVEWLNHFYTKDTVDEVFKDFDSPKDIMKNYSFPTCFDCEKCPLKTSCHYRDAITFEQMIQRVQLRTPIDQKRLFKLLD